MNWHETLYEIYSKLEQHGFGSTANEIKEEQLKGATGGEVFDLVMFQIHRIKCTNPEVYSVIKSEVEDLIKYGKSIGFL